MNQNKILVVNDIPLTWLIRVVDPGERYGLNMCLTNKDAEPYVEFYDTRYGHTDFGQFVSRYYVSTIMDHEGSLCLDGGAPEWAVSGKLIERVKKWLT
jgi:hypothetical protein